MLKMSIIFTLFYVIYTTEAYTYHNMAMLTMNLTTYTPPPIERKLSIGILMGMPPCSMLLYLPLLYIIITRRKKYNNPFYKLVIVIGLNDYVLLVHFMYMGMCIIGDKCPFGETFNLIQMTVAMMVCYGCMLLNLLIAWNRFAAIFFHHYYDNYIFAPKMVYVYVFMVYTISAFANIPEFLHGVKMYPQWGTFWFADQPSLLFIEIWQIFDLVFAYTLHIGLIGMYVAAAIKCYKMTQKSSVDQLKMNRRFLYMAAINGIPCLAYVNCYHFGPSFTADFFALLCMVMTPFVYLWFNAELREDFFGLFRKRTLSPYSSEALKVSKITPLNTSAGVNLNPNGATGVISISDSKLAASLAEELAAEMSMPPNQIIVAENK